MRGELRPAAAPAQAAAAAIEETVRDYFEGWFEGDATRMERALHPELSKRSPAPGGDLDSDPAQQMIDATAAGVGTRHPVERRALEIIINDLYEEIASVTVRSAIYREYLHLTRGREGWKIVHALWLPTGPTD